MVYIEAPGQSGGLHSGALFQERGRERRMLRMSLSEVVSDTWGMEAGIAWVGCSGKTEVRVVGLEMKPRPYH